MSNAEVVVIEWIDVRELLRLLYYFDILNKLLLLQRKHSKYLNAKCLKSSCFKKKFVACMHAFCMFNLHIQIGKSLTKLNFRSSKISSIFVFLNIFNFFGKKNISRRWSAPRITMMLYSGACSLTWILLSPDVTLRRFSFDLKSSFLSNHDSAVESRFSEEECKKFDRIWTFFCRKWSLRFFSSCVLKKY